MWIDGVRFAVLGVIDDVEAHADLLTSVITPESTARQLYAERSHTEATLVVTTRMGAAQVVAEQLPIALDPRFPELILVEAPAPISSLRDAVTSDLDTLLLLLGAVCLVVGMVSIANTTFVAVIERTPEIGLRRAIGARPSHVMSQFLLESTLLGGARRPRWRERRHPDRGRRLCREAMDRSPRLETRDRRPGVRRGRGGSGWAASGVASGSDRTH